jgi:hypothetical protein
MQYKCNYASLTPGVLQECSREVVRMDRRGFPLATAPSARSRPCPFKKISPPIPRVFAGLLVPASCCPTRAHQVGGARQLLAAHQGCLLSRPLCSPGAPLHQCLTNAALTASCRCSSSAMPPLGHRRRCLHLGTGELLAPESSSVTTSFRCVYLSCVSDVLEVCCKCFHIDVAKVDRDVAYIVMVMHACCKGVFQMFHLIFQKHVASVFILDVAYV